MHSALETLQENGSLFETHEPPPLFFFFKFYVVHLGHSIFYLFPPLSFCPSLSPKSNDLSIVSIFF